MGKESAERKSILVKKSSSPERALLFVTLSEICKLFSLYLSNFAILGFAITVCANDVCTEGRPSVLLSCYFWPGHQFLSRASVRLGYHGKMQKGVLIPISASSSSPGSGAAMPTCLPWPSGPQPRQWLQMPLGVLRAGGEGRRRPGKMAK